MKYMYNVPKNTKMPKKYKHIGTMYGKKLIVVEEEIKEFEKYLVKIIDEHKKEPKKPEKVAQSPESKIHKYTVEELKNLTYKELQKIAKEIGVSYKGKKQELIDKISKKQSK